MRHTSESTVTTTQPDKPRRRLRWYQFSLRTLLVLVLLASVGMSWFAVRMQRAKKQREAVEAIRDLRGLVAYDYERDASGSVVPNAQPPGPAWLRKDLGVDFFANVREVWFAGPEITDAELECLKGLTELRRLELSETKVTGPGLVHLKRLTQLETLVLGGARFTDAGLEHLKGLTQLQWLFLERTEVTDSGLEHLKTLTQLQELRLQSTKVTDAGLEHLSAVTQLKSLHLGDTQVTDAGLKHLKGLTQLQSLSLRGTQVTDAGVNDLHEALPNVEIYR